MKDLLQETLALKDSLRNEYLGSWPEDQKKRQRAALIRLSEIRKACEQRLALEDFEGEEQ